MTGSTPAPDKPLLIWQLASITLAGRQHPKIRLEIFHFGEVVFDVLLQVVHRTWSRNSSRNYALRLRTKSGDDNRGENEMTAKVGGDTGKQGCVEACKRRGWRRPGFKGDEVNPMGHSG